MIDLIRQTPDIYNTESRDFQTISRLYTALFNWCKMYTDINHNKNVLLDSKLAHLRARTVNFIPKHEWPLDELSTIATCFKYLMCKKGSKSAIKACLTILIRVENILGNISEDEGTLKITGNKIEVSIPKALASAGIVDDLFDYLLPAGFIYRIKEYKQYDFESKDTEIDVEDKIVELDGKLYDKILSSDLTLYDGDESSEGITRGGTLYKNDINTTNREQSL